MNVMKRPAVFAGLVSVCFLAGCNLVPPATNLQTGSQSGTSANATQVSGRVHGGQQPVAGATIQLWQVGTTGYGTGTAPLGSSVTTFPDGSFNITGAYNCSAAANGATHWSTLRPPAATRASARAPTTTRWS